MKSASFDVCGGRSGFPNLTGMCRILLVASVVLISWSFTACGVRDDRSGSPARGTNASTAAASTPLRSGGTAQILLFNGTGNVALPAVPTANRQLPGVTISGRNSSVCELMSAPATSAQPTVFAASTAVRCCLSKPGFWRLARIRSIRNGWPVTRDSVKDVRRIWPPPSPSEPSIVIIASVFSPLAVRRHLHQLGIELAENGHQVVLSGHHLVDVLIDHRHLVQTR